MSLSTEVLVAIIFGVPSLFVAIISAIFAYMAVKQSRRGQREESEVDIHPYTLIPMYVRHGNRRHAKPLTKLHLLLGDLGTPGEVWDAPRRFEANWQWLKIFSHKQH